MSDILELLRQQADEIAREGHNGWGNTMLRAADEIAALRQQLAEAQIELTCARENVKKFQGIAEGLQKLVARRQADRAPTADFEFPAPNDIAQEPRHD